MPRDHQPERRFSVSLTQVQRKRLAEIAPETAGRLKLDEPNQRAIPFTREELKAIQNKATAAVREARVATVRNSLRHILDAVRQVLERASGPEAIPAKERLYRFKITLQDTHPPIWRRIQVKDCTLDRLHEHIQLAMGWTNSHLNHFHIGDQPYGDPLLMAENFEEFGYEDSTTTKLSDVLPRDGKRFRFEYEYDFGDSWQHEILFEGCLRAEQGKRYPICLEGERVCPPEDVGGVFGYAEFVEAITDPDHEEHDRFLAWSGPFDPEAFDAAAATKRMWRGLPNWRAML